MKRYAQWIWLAQKCGAGSSEISNLVEKMGTIDAIYEAGFDDYSYADVSERLCEDLCDKSLGEANKIFNYCQANRIGILTYDDPKYPESLRSISNAPAVLYYCGRLPNFNSDLFISVVGTRSMSEYGMRAAYKIAYEVASAGAVVVSGMALGVDGVASAAAIAAGGRTVAVLGSGIDRVYPKEHTLLMDMIRQNGVVITEHAPNTSPLKYNFPIRNRIISGISRGAVIVDAHMGSGAMITAKSAIIQGKDIYAVPSNIDSQNSSGTNSLIRDGAQAVLCGNDVIKNYSLEYQTRLNLKRLIESEQRSDLDIDVLVKMGVSSKGECQSLLNNKILARHKSAAPKAEAPLRESDRPCGITSSSEAHKAAEDKVKDKANDKRVSPGSTYEQALSEVKDERKLSGDDSLEALKSLSEKQRKVFEEMPLDLPVTVDYLTKTGLRLGDVISALTVLEVKGLVSSLPGALYIRK